MSETLSKKFQVQARFGKTWIIIKSEQNYKDALDYVRKASSVEYPYRIVRVVKTVMFEEKK
jgi:hypothetical protein